MSIDKTTYYLWLDESGNFEEENNKRPPSLVGGVCCTEAVMKKIKPSTPLQLIAQHPDFQVAFGGERPKLNHSTELPNEVKAPARLLVTQWCAEQGMEFIFFQNRGKIRILDSTTTYLNFLAEGLAQFMAHLSMRGNACLNVIIGRRVDTEELKRTGQIEVIKPEEYLRRIQERVALAQARYLFNGANQVSFNISFDSDKNNGYLVLSDYVCSCKYTLDAAAAATRRSYAEKTGSGLTRRQVLEGLFRDHGKTFGLMEDRLQHDVRRSLSNQDWGGALFLALSQGSPEHRLEEELHDCFARFDARDQRTQMQLFFQLTGQLLRTGDSSGAATVLLEAYLEQLERLPFRFDGLRPFCRLNALLYLSTAHTHSGQTGIASKLLAQCEPLLPELLRQPENWDLYYILRNRQAVVCQDSYRYEEAIALLDEAIMAAKLQQESQDQLYGLLGYAVQAVPSEQLAKLLGTRALTYQYILPVRPELEEDARRAAREAIDAFQYPRDRRRHYMTLAEIELRCGHLDAAVQVFCEGLGGGKLPEILEQCTTDFNWYHALRLADGLWEGNAEQKALSRTIFEQLRVRFDDIFKTSYPAHSAARRAGILGQRIGGNRGFVQRCFAKCEKLCFQGFDGILWSVGLACLADRIVLALRKEEPQAAALEERFSQRCTEAVQAAQMPELRQFYQSLYDGWTQARGLDRTGKERFYQSVGSRVGI